MSAAASMKPGWYHLPLKSEAGRITRWSRPLQVTATADRGPDVHVSFVGGSVLLPYTAPCAPVTP